MLPTSSGTDMLSRAARWYIVVVIRLPRSSMNSADCGHQAPLVSMAIGTKECVAARATYFVVLLTAAFSAAVQAVVEVSYYYYYYYYYYYFYYYYYYNYFISSLESLCNYDGLIILLCINPLTFFPNMSL